MAFSIGIDFGTESGRVLLLDLVTGNEVATSVVTYEHGVIDKMLPVAGNRLPPDWALQHPADYLQVVLKGIPSIIRESGIDCKDVIGIGVDFTSCTVMPVTIDGTPLCLLAEWMDHPHSWPKLWKHHAAQPFADRMNFLSKQRSETFLDRYGGSISSEWYYPKLLQVFEEDPEVYHACHAFIEAADWIIWYLTGHECRNSCTAGFKALWSELEGFPSESFFRDLNPDFTRPAEKSGSQFHPLGTRAGNLRAEVARAVGLTSSVCVSVGIIDAHASVSGAGVYDEGTMVMAMGTSICHLTATKSQQTPPGITGVVKDGVIPGLYGYEAGQAAVGDIFAWFIKNCISHEYVEAAFTAGMSTFEYLEHLATRLIPGQSGLVALDWWNGNRSTVGDANLSGVILGLTLSTSPEEIYRTLLESVAFGTRKIIENFFTHDVQIHDLVACGGLAKRSPLLMQIYADVCQLPITIPESDQTSARGAALLGAVAAGPESGGFPSIVVASRQLKPDVHKTYTPNTDHVTVYDRLYHIYSELYGFFGEEKRSLAHTLKELRRQAYV